MSLHAAMLPEDRYASSFKRSLDALKAAIPLQEYASTLMTLESSGTGRWKGCCPIPAHEDRKPSFCIYSDGHAYCFGCGFHGDLLDLFQAVEGGEKWEAMMVLRERYNVELPKRPPSWFERDRWQTPTREGIDWVRVNVLRRRLFRHLILPLIDATCSDEREREAEVRRAWEEFQRVPVETLLDRYERARDAAA